ncbi:MAG: aldehyde dehydrogenase family protein, partial [Geminicoccaceae bacterium]
MPKIEALKVGPASDRACDRGPVVTQAAKAKILGSSDQGAAEGGRLVVDGRTFRAPQGEEPGFFVGPTLIDKVTPEMTIWKEEIFGPVLSVTRRENY